MIETRHVLEELTPQAEWRCIGEGWENITWYDKKQTKPTEKEFNDKKAELEKQYKDT